jgi:hypothetical protein
VDGRIAQAIRVHAHVDGDPTQRRGGRGSTAQALDSTGEVMTYSTGSHGYPPGQQPTTQFAAPTQQFGKVAETPEGPSKLPVYLTAAVAVLGLAVYVSSFGPLFAAVGSEIFTPIGVDFAVIAAVLAALLAGVSLLPKQPNHNAIAAVLSVLGFLLVMAVVITAEASLDWALYLIVALTLVQAVVAVVALLFDAGVIAPPAPPRPKYEQSYGQYGGPGPGPYYGQPGQHAPSQPGPQQHTPQHQRPGYPPQYGGGYPGGGPSSTGGYSGPQQGGPPTPPTGFPAYGKPPSSSGSSSSAPTTQVPAQPQSSSSSSQSGQAPS